MVQGEFSLSVADLEWKNVWFAMGYRDAVPEERIQEYAREVAERTVPYARMRLMYRVVKAEKLSPRQVSFDGHTFTPNGIICSYLDGMEEACVFLATAGVEFAGKVKELNADGDILTQFIADAIGTVLAELAVEKIETQFNAVLNHSMSYSPGYCNWDIREQQEFFKLFPPEPLGIKLSDSSLMSPEKSVSGFFAMGRNLVRQPYHCEICKNKSCYKRRHA